MKLQIQDNELMNYRKLKMKLPNFLRKYLVVLARKTFLGRFAYMNISHSQDCEDLIVDKLFPNKKSGFYIDIGAHHPYRFSNTYKFYKRGWRDINIDASPNLMPIFHKHRPRDINCCYLVSNQSQELDFYIFDDEALNTIDKNIAERLLYRDPKGYKLKETLKIKSKPLVQILDEQLPIGTTIDFISIDCEWHDLEVLQSNNWDKYRPQVIIIEIHDDILLIQENEIFKFLNRIGYKLLTKQILSAIFVDTK